MGLISADIMLSNVRKPDIQPVKVAALVDTGAVHLCIPEHIALQLDLDTYEEREVETADGSSRKRPYVGPILAQFANRHCLTGAMVLGNEVLLGAIPMEDMDLVINPSRRTVTVNPANPTMRLARLNLIRKMFQLSVIPAWTAGIQIAGMPQTPPSMEPRFRRSMPERRCF